MGISRIEKTSPLPIVVNLWDGATNKFPRVWVRDATGTLLFAGPIDLPHVGEGLYEDLTKTHSSFGIVTATFVVYNDSGHTIESEIHQRSSDVFLLVPDPIVPPLSGSKLEALLMPEKPLSGILSSDLFLGQVASTELQADLSIQLLTAVISDTKILGQVRCE